MNTTEEIKTRIHEWVIGHFPLAKERKIGPEDSLLESGIVDSLGTLDIVLFLENEFGFVVDDDEMVSDHFETVQLIAQFVDSKVKL